MENNRSRKHKFTLYLSDDEYRILNAKFKISGVRSRSSFLRQMIIVGYVYDVDYSYLREYNYLLGHRAGKIAPARCRGTRRMAAYASIAAALLVTRANWNNSQSDCEESQ